jgi:hypothetical protein
LTEKNITCGIYQIPLVGLSEKSDFTVFVIPVLQLQFVQIPESPD